MDPIPNENGNRCGRLTIIKLVVSALFTSVIIIVPIVISTRPDPSTPHPSSKSTSNLTSTSNPKDIFAVSNNITPPPNANDGSFNYVITVDISESFITIGNWETNDWKGELYIYNIDGSYLQTIRAEDGEKDDEFARRLSIHDEWIVVGSPWRTRGKTYAYNVSGDLLAELTAPDSTDGDYFGWSVGISETNIVIGAPGNGRGKAYVYTMTSNGLSIPIEIEPNDLDKRGEFASVLSLSGNLIVFGAPDQDNWRGIAYLYNVMGQQIAKLEASDGQFNDRFGLDVAIDGGTIVVGAPWHDNHKGAIYIFDGSGTQIHKVMDPDGEEFDWFGWNVDASNNYIAVRTKNHVFIYDKAGTMLAKRNVPFHGDVALTDGKLVVVHDNENVILMEHPISK